MQITFLGGTDEVGASAILVETAGKRILVDCGIRMGNRSPLPELDRAAGGLDAIVLTHGHLDHIGALPVLHRGLPLVPVYATPPTIALARVMLGDAAKIMAQDSEREEELPLYSAHTVASLLERMAPAPPGMPERIGADVTATFFLCGHIIGAASVGIESPEGRVLVSGDVSVAEQLSVAGMGVPPFRPDVLVLESTYGDRLHADRTRQEEQLAAQIAERIQQGGKVLIPAFAVGRAQEVLLIIRRAMRLGRIPRFTTWVDGLVRPVCGLYTSFSAFLRPKLRELVEKVNDPFFGDIEEIRPVASPEQRKEILAGPPCAIIASSGMLTGGASVSYAETLVNDPTALIAVTGYQDEESPGRQLLAAADGQLAALTLKGRSFDIKCGVKRYQLSAHADAGELVGIASRLKPADTVLVHGGAGSRASLAQQLSTEQVGRVHLPVAGQTLVFTGRRRAGAVPLREIGAGRPLCDNIDELADKAITLRGHNASWQVAHLLRLWGEAGLALEDAQKLLLASGRFSADVRRPFSLKPVPREGAPAAGAAPQLAGATDPIDELLARIGTESGLYRHSADRAQRVLTLRFNFPARARERFTADLDATLGPLGWTWSIHPSPNLAALLALAKKGVEEHGGAALKASAHLDRNEVVVRVAKELDAAASAKVHEAFTRETGFALAIEAQPSYCLPKTARRADGRLEMNAAFNAIDEAFANERHKPYKKSLLHGAGGGTIELAFVSPQVAERYRERIDAVSRRTGWSIACCAVANQHRIKEIAATLARELGLAAVKNPSFFAAQRLLRLPVGEIVPPEKAAAFKARFEEDTGFVLEIVKE